MGEATGASNMIGKQHTFHAMVMDDQCCVILSELVNRLFPNYFNVVHNLEDITHTFYKSIQGQALKEYIIMQLIQCHIG